MLWMMYLLFSVFITREFVTFFFFLQFLAVGLLGIGLTLIGDVIIYDYTFRNIFYRIQFYNYYFYDILVGIAASSVVIGILTIINAIVGLCGSWRKSSALIMTVCYKHYKLYNYSVMSWIKTHEKRKFYVHDYLYSLYYK